jgi:hypothetical protein
LSEIGSGYFIRLDKTEQEKIEKFLNANNYEVSGDGIKKFIFDFLSEENQEVEGEEKTNPFIEGLKNNPEAVAGAINFANTAFKNFLKKKVGI